MKLRWEPGTTEVLEPTGGDGAGGGDMGVRQQRRFDLIWWAVENNGRVLSREKMTRMFSKEHLWKGVEEGAKNISELESAGLSNRCVGGGRRGRGRRRRKIWLWAPGWGEQNASGFQRESWFERLLGRDKRKRASLKGQTLLFQGTLLTVIHWGLWNWGKVFFYLNFRWRHLHLGLREELGWRKERGMSRRWWCWMGRLLEGRAGGCWELRQSGALGGRTLPHGGTDWGGQRDGEEIDWGMPGG